MKLLIPGPVEVRDEILQVMSKQLINHRSIAATEIQKSLEKNMQKIWNTKNDILCSTTSGTGLMEAAIKSCTLKKAAIFSIGGFGKKWFEVAVASGIDADIYEAAPGKPTTPEMIKRALDSGIYDVITITHNETSTGVQNNLEELSKVYREYDVLALVDTVSSAGGTHVDVDKNAIDIAITSTQKCLGLPPGMAFCSISKRAKERIDYIGKRGYYLDLNTLLEFMETSHQYISTPNLSLMRATQEQLNYIINIEGLENRISRHKKMAKMVQDFARSHGGLYADEKYLSDTITTVKIDNIETFEILRDEMAKYGYLLGSGYGNFKHVNFRIAHMADRKVEDLEKALEIMSEIWNTKIKNKIKIKEPEIKR